MPTSRAMARYDRAARSGDEPVRWESLTERLTEGGWFWLSTVRPDGRAHAMPLFAAWADPVFFIASKDSARKARNLERNPSCVLTKDLGDTHLVVEGTARHVTDPETLARASTAFGDVYEWPTRVGDNQLDADYGAPTSGGPPYQVFEIRPVTAFVLPADDGFTPTRVSF